MSTIAEALERQLSAPSHIPIVEEFADRQDSDAGNHPEEVSRWVDCADVVRAHIEDIPRDLPKRILTAFLYESEVRDFAFVFGLLKRVETWIGSKGLAFYFLQPLCTIQRFIAS